MITLSFTDEDIEKIQQRFSFAWEHTTYRANLVALRTELKLRPFISLPVDAELAEILTEMGFQGRPQNPTIKGVRNGD